MSRLPDGVVRDLCRVTTPGKQAKCLLAFPWILEIEAFPGEDRERPFDLAPGVRRSRRYREVVSDSSVEQRLLNPIGAPARLFPLVLCVEEGELLVIEQPELGQPLDHLGGERTVGTFGEQPLLDFPAGPLLAGDPRRCAGEQFILLRVAQAAFFSPDSPDAAEASAAVSAAAS